MFEGMRRCVGVRGCEGVCGGGRDGVDEREGERV